MVHFFLRFNVEDRGIKRTGVVENQLSHLVSRLGGFSAQRDRQNKNARGEQDHGEANEEPNQAAQDGNAGRESGSGAAEACHDRHSRLVAGIGADVPWR